MVNPVPVADSLADIYPPTAIGPQAPRWSSLLEAFTSNYSHSAAFIARSPGRVNIIGEHIDYSLYAVLPMAITADALIAVSCSPNASDTFKIRIANLQPERFPSREFTVSQSGDVEINAKEFEWTNYFKSGLRGAMALLRKKHGQDLKFKDMNIVMDGTVPVGGGLSSSAAFVSASALAVMVANGEASVDKTELTELAIVSERAVGVNSGGMDQSASVLSEKGSALHVAFSPRLSTRPIAFPPTSPELTFLIAQSFVTSNKQVTGPIHYNLRVVEVSLAAAYLHASLNPPGSPALPEDAGPLGVSLKGFHDAYFYHNNQDKDGSAGKSLGEEAELEKLIEVVGQTLTKQEGYTREDIATVLGISVPELEKRFMSTFPVRADAFKLRQRALHVFTEALRVIRFLSLLSSASATTRPGEDTTTLNTELGALMNETQDSCRDLYECSCPELDRICSISRSAGAYAARLTGAGWGGCTVHLVPADKVEAVKAALEKDYYQGMELTEEQKEQAVVVSRPATGAAIYMVEDGTVR